MLGQMLDLGDESGHMALDTLRSLKVIEDVNHLEFRKLDEFSQDEPELGALGRQGFCTEIRVIH